MKPNTALHGQSLRAQPMSAHATCNQQSGVFIDRIRITAPCLHRPLGNRAEWTDPDTGLITHAAGGIQQALEEGHADVYVQSKQVSRGLGAKAILIDCCPPKVLQGHNVFGHAVLRDYVYEILDRVTRVLGIAVRPQDRAMWRAGNIDVTGIHLTANFTYRREQIVPIIDAIDLSNRHGKQRILPTWIGLGYTPNGRSKYHTVTLYGKLEEMGEKPEPPTINHHRLWGEAGKSLRVEIKLFPHGLDAQSKSKSFGGYNLKKVAGWAGVDVAALFFHVFGKYHIVYAVQPVPTLAELKVLEPKELNAYLLWDKGYSLKELFPNRGTAGRYATVIQQKLGVNIRVDRRAEEQPEIDLKELFTPGNVRPVPNWAKGTKYYVSPATVVDREEGSGDPDE